MSRKMVGFGSFGVIATFLLVALTVTATLVISGSSVSAGGEGGVGTEGVKIAETTFTVNVEPIKVEFALVKGQTYQMRPGDPALLEVRITNTSPTRHWAVRVEMSNVSNPYQSDLMVASASWDNGKIYNPNDVIVVQAGVTSTLSVLIIAADGAGTENISISVYRT